MIEQLRVRFQGRDPSLTLAAASALRCAAEHGDVTFGALTTIYRDDHQMVYHGAGELAMQGGNLSVEEVARHLEESILPRLVIDDVFEALPEDLKNDTVIPFTAALRALVAPGPEAARDALIRLATDDLLRLEPASAEPFMETMSGIAHLAGRGLTKVYKKRAVVDNVDFDLRRGEIVGLLGPNGAGKTTCFYMVVGLIRPDAGEVVLDGSNLSPLPMYQRARRGIGYLSQEPSVFRKLTVEQNVLAILETLKITSAERERRLEILLDELSIKHLRTILAYKLSGGERRRLEITRALVTQPKFMLLDEPFAGVDPIAVHDIQVIVAGLRRRGMGVLITDHNVEQTLDIVDRAYIMFEGKVQVSGTVRELVFNDRVADLYLGPTLTARLRERLGTAA